MNRAVIGIGSNIQPQRHVPAAVEEIARRHRLLGKSRFITTKPIGPADQPDYVNGAVLVETEMPRPELQAWLKSLEERLGRVRTAETFGPRTIDLDVLVWNGQVVSQDVATRPFLRDEIKELLPELKL